MSGSMFSADWYRIADVRPQLRTHASIHRHSFRGRVWYVLQDEASGKLHRFSPQAYALVGLMDGERTVDEIWHSSGERLSDDMPSQDEVIRLLGELYRASALQAGSMPDIEELSRRSRDIKKRKWLAILKSPLALKIPLVDPETFLSRNQWMARLLFNPVTGLIWLLCVSWALVQTAVHWDALTGNLADRVLATENMLLLAMVYPLVKLVHELGHAWAIKRWGGEVHEMGLMFLIFIPVPYVDASSSAAFRSKYQRMTVAAAGILTEAFIAALAMMLWANAEPGLTRSLAFNVLLICGVSTLLFNGNPLLRFDAYYVLSDWLEIPNMAERGNRQVGYLARRWLLGIDSETSPADSRGEARWSGSYAVLAFGYRIFITLTIALFVASELFFVGVMLACWSLYNVFLKPLLNMLHFLIADPAIRTRRFRVWGATLLGLCFITTMLFVVPLPKLTVAHGVVSAPEGNRVLSGTNGFFSELLVQPGSYVTVGTPLVQHTNSDLDASVEETAARLEELFLTYQSAASENRRVEARLIAEEVESTREELKRVLDEQQQLVTRSPANGTFSIVLPIEPQGRFLPRGTLLGYVLEPGEYRVTVAVDQDEVQDVRADVREVNVRLAEQYQQSLPASVVREVPGAQKVLPSPALGVEGGGRFALDPESTDQPKAFDPVFLFDVQLSRAPAHRIGERVYVRFEHSPEPAGTRIYRQLRRVMLRELEF